MPTSKPIVCSPKQCPFPADFSATRPVVSRTPLAAAPSTSLFSTTKSQTQSSQNSLSTAVRANSPEPLQSSASTSPIAASNLSYKSWTMNEPHGLKHYMQSVVLAYQLAPPHIHHTNAAEKAIDTWKCHFLAGLASVDPNFPIRLWCCLIS